MAWARLAKISPPRVLATFAIGAVCAVLVVSYLLALDQPLPNRSLKLSDDTPSVAAIYNFHFDNKSTSTLGSIDFQFCANDPIVGAPCTVPAGLDVSGATLTTQAGNTGFAISPASSPNDLILTRPPASAAATTNNYVFSNVVNPSAGGSYYVRIQTFASNDASGSYTEYGGLAYAITNLLSISVTVPPYLIFCVAISVPGPGCNGAIGNYINFGILLPTSTRSGSTQMYTATNGRSGYTVSVSGTTLTSGNNTIPALASDVSRPGVSQFGINLRGNSSPSVGRDAVGTGTVANGYDQANFFRFNTGDPVAQSPSVDGGTKYTVSYIVNIVANQAPGVYVSTLTYTCLANF